MKIISSILLIIIYLTECSAQFSCTPIKNNSGEISYYKYSDGYSVPKAEYIESDRISTEALTKFKSGDVEAATTSTKEALILNKYNSEALYCIGLIQIGANKTRKSLSYFEKCTKLSLDSSKYWHQKGEIQIRLGSETDSSQYFSAAVISLSQAIKINPKNKDYWMERARSKSLLDDKLGALKDCQEVTQLEPNYDLIWEMIGNINNDLGSSTDSSYYFDRAISAFSKAIQINNNNSEFWVERANSKYNKKDINGAKKDCQKAVDIRPENTNAWYLLFSIYYDDNNMPACKKYLNKAIAIDPSNIRYWLRRSRLKVELKDQIGALADLDSAIMHDSKCVECYFERATLKKGYPFFDYPGTVIDYSTVLDLKEYDRHGFSAIANYSLWDCTFALNGVHLFSIAIGNYESSKMFETLDYPARDIAEFEQLFTKKDLVKNKTTLINSQATTANIMKELRRISEEGFIVENEYGGTDFDLSGIGIFYFSGHGLTINGRSGICPYDYKNESDIIYLDSIQKYFENSRNMGVICFIESCKNENFSNLANSIKQENDQENDTENNIIFLFSTEEGKRSFGNSAGGYYNQAILEGLTNGVADANEDTFITIGELFQFVKNYVSTKTKGSQIPQIKARNSQINEIFFRAIKK